MSNWWRNKVDHSGSKNTRRIGGAVRYETSALIVKYAVRESKLGVYTSGEVFADALVAGPYAGLKNAPDLSSKGISFFGFSNKELTKSK